MSVERRQLVLLLFVMVGIVTLVTAISIAVLYQAAFEGQRARLVDSVKAEARLIEAVAAFDARNVDADKYSGTARDATISQVKAAHRAFSGFGETGEFVLAESDGQRINFILEQRHGEPGAPQSIQLTSAFAEPIKRALRGRAGTMVGLDYSGRTVLAAFEPVAVLNLGLVAKIDVAEIRRPFYIASLIAGTTATVLILIGIQVLTRLSRPLIARLEDQNEYLQQQVELRTRESRNGEQFASALLDHTPDPTVIVDADGTIVRANKQVAATAGYRSNELVGNRAELLVPERLRQAFARQLADYLENPEPRSMGAEMGLTFMRKDGTEFPIDISLSPIHTEGGMLVGATMRDITQQLTLLDDLESARSSAERQSVIMSKVFMDSADPIVIEDFDGIITNVNREGERTYGFKREELVGKHNKSLVPPERHAQADELLARVTAGEVVRDVESLRWNRERKKVPVLLTLSVLKDDSGEPVAIAAITKDISALKQVEYELEEARSNLEMRVEQRTLELSQQAVELEQAKQAAEIANRAKSDFLANMSHEIRTPMNAILGYTQILLNDDTLGGEHSSAVKNILTSGEHLLELINEILDLSKIEAGRMDLNIEDFDLQAVAQSLSVMFSMKCQQKQLFWQAEVPAEPCLVQGDQTKLRQVLINLLGNAAKFTDTGGVSFVVQELAEGEYLFSVEDSGRGIAEETQNDIFNPFQQDREGIAKGGTGLGLAIAKRYVELMGSKLQLVSQPGEGARFFFTLKLPAAAGPVASVADERRKIVGIAGERHITALVADDIEDNRNILQKILGDLGIEVLLACNGQEAVDLARERQPDIAFMDIRMPVMDGIEALRQIDMDFPNDEIKTVAVTASVFKHQREELEVIGCDDFIDKPVRIERIQECLKNLLKLDYVYQTADELEADAGSAALESDLAGPALPDDLYQALKSAVAAFNVTDTMQVIAEIEQSGDEYSDLAAHLRSRAESFQMEEIQQTLAALNHE